MKKRNKFWIAIGIGSVIIILLIIISNVLNVGEKLRRIHPYLEYGFYGLTAILVYFLILNPMRIILLSPSFSIVTSIDEDNKKNYKIYKRAAKNVLKNNKLEEEDKLRIKSGLKNKKELAVTMSRLYDSKLKKQINKIIIKNAKTVFISTAICQNGKLDMMTVITMNLKMIKDIVRTTGFRPSYSKLGRLSLNVLGTALIADSLDDLDFTEMFPTATIDTVGQIPLVKPVTNSILNGLSNGVLTLRIGIVTRRYLFRDIKKASKTDIRNKSIKESVRMFPILLKEIASFLPKRMGRMFKKKDSKAESEFL